MASCCECERSRRKSPWPVTKSLSVTSAALLLRLLLPPPRDIWISSVFLRADWRVDWSIATSVSSVVCANNCSSSSNRFQSISNSCVHTTHTRVWLMRSNPPTLISTELFIPFFFPSNNNFKKVVGLFYREIYTRKVKRWRSFFLSSFWPAADPSNPSYLSWT